MLNIYKASAGSGKTYTLALIYIDLIIDDFNKYSRILAVTFTNKSTAEMKSRIIKNLYTISTPEAKGHANLLEAQKEYRRRQGKAMVNDIEIITSCKNALVLLLNNYSQFNIFTIDKFVQKIIRSFAFENRLSADYRVNIDTDQTKGEMVDRLMAKMEYDTELQDWLTRLMNERMEDGSGWNIEGKLSPIAKSLLQGHELKSVDRKILEESRKRNRELLKEAYKPIIAGLEELKRLDIQEEELHGKSKNPIGGILNVIKKGDDTQTVLKQKDHFKKIVEKLEKAINSEKLFKAGDRPEVVSLLKKIYEAITTEGKKIATIKLLDSNFYSLGIINDLKQTLSELEQEQHMQVIGGANQLLKRLIGNAPIPFIYEKAGSRFDNIMIDEFQDTSETQWENFKPLIENSLDTNNLCLLVGDVKQAIYRWRNSNWKLLSEIVYKDRELAQHIVDNTLGVNWRSSKNVIEFNNDIFPVIAKRGKDYVMGRLGNDETSGKMLDVICDIYSNGQQKVPEHTLGRENEGFVQIEIIELDKNGDAIQMYKNQQVVDTINTLMEQGYNLSDICILIRNNKEATDIVKTLNEAGISVLSNQALFICESQSIKALLSILSLVVSDDDEPSLAHILAFTNKTSVEELYESWNGELREETKQKIKHLRGLGLLELVYKAIDMLPEEVRERDYIFLEAFIEKAKGFVDGHAASPKDFIEYVEAHKETFVIQAPEGQDAVNITSIHKSKGLEFPIVLIPNGDWNLFKKNSSMWCNMEDDDLTPLNTMELPLTPIKETNYEDQYYDEATQSIVDNMNLLYVAFTRAKDGLFVWSEHKEPSTDDAKKNVENVTISNLIKCSLNMDTPIKYVEDGEEKERNICLHTTEENIEIEVEDEEENVTLNILRYSRGNIEKLKSDKVITTSEKESLPTVSFGGDITKRINQTRDEEEEESNTEIGTAKHGIMQEIDTAGDMDKSVRRALINGEINEEEAKELVEWFNKGQEDETIRSWFDGSQRVINESIILNGRAENRTDRVMINSDGEITIVDYKFAQKDDKHIKQVKNYMTLVKQAGFEKVNGYLWYGSDEKPVSVVS
ncbi:MAG: UvrD-helicase domain-containing protein [Bacteroidia bacterium]|nr:UvrD-helicase domain-containing protein [Bacteroidia bacterium]